MDCGNFRLRYLVTADAYSAENCSWNCPERNEDTMMPVFAADQSSAAA
jgi:hypothetical protein